uniref:Uncharacterized protein n=1 Tax=Arundo donax TaxID=35708 RepID=A0A0A9E6R0_ARUDO
MASIFSCMICSRMRWILLRQASVLRGAVPRICMSLDDGKRSATVSTDVTSSSRMLRNDCTLEALSSSSVLQILRRWRHCSPYALNTMPAPLKKSGRSVAFMCLSANKMSCVFMTSCAASSDETTSMGTWPC